MNDHTQTAPASPAISVERLSSLSVQDLHDLCDATDSAIEAGGGFGWVELPSREILEKFWQGVVAMPQRILLVARLDGVICGTAQLVLPPKNNEAQKLTVQLTSLFVAVWARGHGLGRLLLQEAERTAAETGFEIINLDVRETMTSAIALYESSGYTLFGRHPHYAKIGDEVIPGRYYFKQVGQAAPAADKTSR